MGLFAIARCGACALLFLAALHSRDACAQSADPVARARALVEQKDSKAAFELLAPLESRNAGKVDFDYWLGAAALDAGHLERAVIAFERVLVVNPDFDSARLELGRAYLRMGSLDLAAQEFTRLLGRAPTSAGRALLEDYLAQIQRLRQRQRYSFAAFAELGAGRDTNLSSTTADFSSAILGSFGLPGIEPTGNSIRRADNLVAAAAGAELAYRLREDRTIFALADLRWRGYRDFSDYDYRLGDVVMGYQASSAEFSYLAMAFLQAFRQEGAFADILGGDRLTSDRNASGASLEARRPLDATTQIALGAQFAAFRYPTNAGQDTNQVQMSVSLEKRPAWWPGGTLLAKLYYNHDDARRTLNPFTETRASRHAHGLRLLAQSEARARLSWQSAFGWSRRIDDDPYARATLVATGRDDLFEVLVKASWRVGEAWMLQPYALYIANRSNIDLYTYRKAEGGLTLRREFR